MGGLEGEWFLELTTVRNPVVLHEHSPAGALQEALPTPRPAESLKAFRRALAAKFDSLRNWITAHQHLANHQIAICNIEVPAAIDRNIVGTG